MLYVKAKRITVKYEDIYLKFGSRIVEPEPTDVGRQQFFEFESYGTEPETPDPYYLRLSEGRKWMDWQRNELKDSYRRFLNNDPECGWYGWYQLHVDWKGELRILKMLMNWCKTMPDWVCNEETTLNDIIGG